MSNTCYIDLFSAVFALYFAANIGAARDYNVFDTAAVMACDHKALCRFILGTVFLNIIPTLYYVFMIHAIPAVLSLGLLCRWGNVGIWNDLWILFLGTAGAGFYRILAGIMMCQSADKQFVFYASQHGEKKMSCKTVEKKNINWKGFYTRPKVAVERLQLKWFHHICGGVLYLVVPVFTVCVAWRNCS